MLNYDLFFRFYDKFKGQGFQDIDPKDSLVLEMEDKLSASGQFLHVADLIELKILYLCRRCYNFFGVERDNMNPAVYIEKTHEDDMNRFAMGRSKILKVAGEMFHDKSKNWFLSTHVRTLTNSGEYRDVLYQLCLMYTEVPHKTIHSFQVNTDITELLSGQHGVHYYVGRDPSIFRYPDKKMLRMGNIFSQREFDIIKGIAQGLESHEIAEKLFLSVHTVNTHRRNILSKTDKRSTHELVHDLKERGVI